MSIIIETTIKTENNQGILIKPNVDFTGIEVVFKQPKGQFTKNPLRLNREEMVAFINQMNEVMDYSEEQD
jgi:hypothetical protein